jgi:Mor family transcriptional regulator
MARPEYPRVLEDLATDITLALMDAGIDDPLAARVGVAAVESLRRLWGGTQIYVPRGSRVAVAARNAEIFRELAAADTVEARAELARRHGISERHLRRLIGALQLDPAAHESK